MQHARTVFRTVRLIHEQLTGKFLEMGKTSSDEPCPELTMPQCNALMVVRDEGAMTIKDFAERLHVSAPSASVMADRLVEMGMLERRPSPSDRRAVLISATDNGREAIASIETEIFSLLMRIMKELGDEQSRQWSEIYAKIGGMLERDLFSEDRGPGPLKEVAR